MKTWLTAWAFLLFLIAALPIAADQHEKEQAVPEEDTILGTWHAQYAEDEILPADSSVRLVFNKEGRLIVYVRFTEDDDGDIDEFKYEHDERNAKLTLKRLDDEGNVQDETDLVFHYDFVDGMLILRFKEAADAEEETMELTRNREGTRHHQKLRAEAAGKPGRLRGARETARAMQSSTQMRGLHQAAVVYSQANQDVYAKSLGELLIGAFFTPEYLLSPWSKTEVPEGFDDWQDKKKIDWANKNASYIYLCAGKKAALNSELIAIFELPASVEQEQVRLLFDDNHTQSMAFAKADKLIKEQTGHTLAQWMKTTSPGTGQMVVPEEKE